MRTLNAAWPMWRVLCVSSVFAVVRPGSSAAFAGASNGTTPGWAQGVGLVAEVQANARSQGQVISGGFIWTCSGTRCGASGKSTAVAAPVAVCQALARAVGLMRSFTVGSRPLNAIELQQCNSAVPAVSPAPPSPAPVPAPAPSVPAARTYPVNVLTSGMTVTGTGLLNTGLPFTAKRLTTDGMTVTGTGALAVNLPFTPKNILTTGMTVTGTGSIR